VCLYTKYIQNSNGAVERALNDDKVCVCLRFYVSVCLCLSMSVFVCVSLYI